MAELVTQDRGKRRNGAAHAAVLVSGYELARHFGCSRQNVELLAEQGVIERRASDGKFDQDVCRLKYLQHLRSERQRSPRAAADAEYVAAKAALLRIRIEEKQRTLVRADEVDELVDGLCGVVLAALSGLPARCAPRGDLATRRNIERVVFEVRTEMAAVCQRMADKNGEPPLNEQD
jgi:hypothetical protein